jgi:hypothetical protein
MALGTAQSLNHIVQSGVPTHDGGERVRETAADVAALTTQVDDVLAKFVV